MIRSQLLSTHSHSFLQKRGSAHSSKNLFSRQQRTLFIFDLLSGKLNNPQYREKKINESEKKANERKKKLADDLHRGFVLKDAMEAKKTDTKVWGTQTLPELSARRRAATFPNMRCVDSSNQPVMPHHVLRDKYASVVTVFYSQNGFQLAQPWMDIYARHLASPDTQLVAINVVEKLPFRLFKSWMVQKAAPQIMAAMDRTGDREEHADRSAMFYFGNSYQQRQELNMVNRQVPYVFLVDEGARIRWKTAGKPTEEESRVLAQLTQELVTSRKEQNAPNKHRR